MPLLTKEGIFFLRNVRSKKQKTRKSPLIYRDGIV